MQLSQIGEILDEARNGRPFALIDSDDEEGVASMVMPAQFATPVQITRMAGHGCGPLYLAVTERRAEELGLHEIGATNHPDSDVETVVSIGHRTGSGATACDRARTVALAVNPSCTVSDIVTPGSVVPVIVREGGVLVRPGHAEAAVDIVRLAGLMPAAVLYPVCGSDGKAMRRTGLAEFARCADVRTVTVTDLVTYRRARELLVDCVVCAPFDSHYGSDFEIRVYRDLVDGAEHIALVRGNVLADRQTLVRIHQLDMTADLLRFQSAHPEYIPFALRTLAAHEGAAVGIFLQDSDSSSTSSLVASARRAYASKKSGRDYGIAAQILKDIGVGRITLLTSSLRKMEAIKGFGLEVTERRPMAREGKERFVEV